MRLKLDRSFYIPKGALCFRDRESSAVVYAYETAGALYALAFHGKAQKPDWHHRFKTAAARDEYARRHFESWRRAEASQLERRAARKAWRHSFNVGDIFKTCWGYEQTNVEYFECVEVRGQMLILREIAQEREGTGWETGRCVPIPGKYIDGPIRRRAQEGGVKISSCQWASYQAPKLVAGVPTYESAHWSSYH